MTRKFISGSLILLLAALMLLSGMPAATVYAADGPIGPGEVFEIGDTITYVEPYYIWKDRRANFYDRITNDLVVSSVRYQGYDLWSIAFQDIAIYNMVYVQDSDQNPAVGIRVKSGDGTKENPYEFEIVHSYSVTVADAKNGTITADRTTAVAGETVTLTAAPDSTYEVDAISVTYGSGQTITPVQDPEDPAVYRFEMPKANVTVSAAFKVELRTVTFSQNCDDEVTGMPDSVTVEPDEDGGYLCPEPAEIPVREGYVFDGWYAAADPSGAEDAFFSGAEGQKTHAVKEHEETAYAGWKKAVEAVDLTVEIPPCGQKVTAADSGSSDPMPEVSIQGDGHIEIAAGLWKQAEGGQADEDSFTITGEQKYTAVLSLKPEEGYAFTEDTQVTVNGEAATLTYVGPEEAVVEYEIEAVHEMGDWACTQKAEAGGEGTETRECVGSCGAVETRKFRYAVVSGDGSVWTRDSGETCDLTFERSLNDEETFGKYEGVLVDGEPVDDAYVDAAPGSVKISLKVDYLQTLAAGEHELTAVFSDGSASGTFTVQEPEAKPADPADPADKGDAPDTGDRGGIGLWLLLCAGSLAGASGILIRRRTRRA